MLRINHPDDRNAIAAVVGITLTGIDPVIVRVEQDLLYGGFGFTNFTGNGGSIWGHAAGFRAAWPNREVLRAAFGYVFNQLSCRVLFTRVADDNLRALDFNDKLCFTRLYHLEHVYPNGRGQWIFRMFPNECKWLPRSSQGNSLTVH